MILKFAAAVTGTLAVAALSLSLSGTSASAQSRDAYARNKSPNVSYQQGPRTRIFVSRRNWLDLGTEVRPGERKYTDYAIPPGNSVVDNLTGRPFARQPFNDVWDLPGYQKSGYGY